MICNVPDCVIDWRSMIAVVRLRMSDGVICIACAVSPAVSDIVIVLPALPGEDVCMCVCMSVLSCVASVVLCGVLCVVSVLLRYVVVCRLCVCVAMVTVGMLRWLRFVGAVVCAVVGSLSLSLSL